MGTCQISASQLHQDSTILDNFVAEIMVRNSCGVSLNSLIQTILLKSLKIAFVDVFEICNQISFALILKTAPGARKATSVQSSTGSEAANCLARGRARLADFGLISPTSHQNGCF